VPPYYLRKTLAVLFTTKAHRTASILCAFAVSLFLNANKTKILYCAQMKELKKTSTS